MQKARTGSTFICVCGTHVVCVCVICVCVLAAGALILVLPEFAVDYFWTVADRAGTYAVPTERISESRQPATPEERQRGV